MPSDLDIEFSFRSYSIYSRTGQCPLLLMSSWLFLVLKRRSRFKAAGVISELSEPFLSFHRQVWAGRNQRPNLQPPDFVCTLGNTPATGIRVFPLFFGLFRILWGVYRLTPPNAGEFNSLAFFMREALMAGVPNTILTTYKAHSVCRRRHGLESFAALRNLLLRRTAERSSTAIRRCGCGSVSACVRCPASSLPRHSR